MWNISRRRHNPVFVPRIVPRGSTRHEPTFFVATFPTLDHIQKGPPGLCPHPDFHSMYFYIIGHRLAFYPSYFQSYHHEPLPIYVGIFEPPCAKSHTFGHSRTFVPSLSFLRIIPLYLRSLFHSHFLLGILSIVFRAIIWASRTLLPILIMNVKLWKSIY
ncbi:hypothetical protein CPC08DRAFT_710230 [Agrocybe pediades]|nr:hypothetical protein CPC08DRAFT_710230 [Agrocybe pediades]